MDIRDVLVWPDGPWSLVICLSRVSLSTVLQGLDRQSPESV